MKTSKVTALLSLALLAAAAPLSAQHFELRSLTLANGGASAGGSYTFSDIIGQPVQGTVSGGGYSFQLGAVQPAALPPAASNVDWLVTATPLAVVVTENFTAPLTLSVSNRGPDTATVVQLSANLPAGLFVQSFTNSAGACQVTGSNVTCAVASLPSQGAFTVALTLRARFLAESSRELESLSGLSGVVSATETDLNPADNVLTRPVTVWVQLDFGDARGGFPVSLAENGARHRYWPGYRLGALWDRQTDGFHSPLADWDDTHGLATPDDEDGVVFVTPLVPGYSATVIVTSSFAGFLVAWADFNNDGDWADAGEQIFSSQPLAPGANTLTFRVPAGATVGQSTTRWRASTTGGLRYAGYGGPGEVEDHIATNSAPPVVFAGLQHAALGSATVSVSSNCLRVSNLGSNGQDGVSIGLRELSRTARVQFCEDHSEGGGMTQAFAAYGMVNDEPERFLGKLTLQNTNGATELLFDPGANPVATMLRVEVYNHDALAGSMIVPASGVLGAVSGAGRLAAVTVGAAEPSASEWTLWELEFSAPISFSPQGLTGNRVRLVAVNPSGGALQNLARLEVTGRNLASLVVQEESAPIFQPRLRIARTGQRLKLSWDTRNAELQKAPSVNGRWTRVFEGGPIAELENGGGFTFYRVVISTNVLEAIASAACRLRAGDFGYVCQRNVLLLIADDVGVDQIPRYLRYYNRPFSSAADNITVNTPAGNPATLMPTVDKLAASGVTFLNAWSSPVCSPTRACLFTGTHAYRHGVYDQLGPTGLGLPLGTKTSANVLHDSGYTNGLFGKWHCGEDPAFYPNPLGPPYSFGWGYHAGALGGGLTDYYKWEKVTNGTAGTCMSYATTNNVEDALTWIGSQTKPWMATVAFNAPHWSQNASGKYYTNPPAGCEYQPRTATAATNAYYRSMLECLDRSITNLLTRIDPDVLANTTIIFMGDNGTETNMTDHFTAARYGTVSHGKDSLYEGGINVPLIIADGYTFLYGQESPWTKGTGRVVSPDRVETSVVQTLDLFATIAEIGRGDGSCGADSVSLVPYLKSASASAQRDVIYAESHDLTWDGSLGSIGWDVALRNASHKLIIRDFLSSSNSYELYDLTTDRWETTNLWDGSPTDNEILAKLTLVASLSKPVLKGCP